MSVLGRIRFALGIGRRAQPDLTAGDAEASPGGKVDASERSRAGAPSAESETVPEAKLLDGEALR